MALECPIIARLLAELVLRVDDLVDR